MEDGAAVGVTDGTGVDVAAGTLGLEGCDWVEDVAAVGVAVGPGVDGADTLEDGGGLVTSIPYIISPQPHSQM